MSKVNIFWDPHGLELDSVGRKKYLRCTDGDTPYVSIPIRMLSIDTPEVHYPGNQKPSRHDARLAELAGWIAEGRAPISAGLAQHLHPKLATGCAGTLQERQGEIATDKFEELISEKLTRPSGSKRSLFLHAADTPFDSNGRLLAYMAPCYSATELASLSPKDRATFNLLMVESGWAASFLIYPSLPKCSDLVLFHQAAKDAYDNRRGAWGEPMMLTGYEFRMCIKLHQITEKLLAGESLSSKERGNWVTRYCVDMTTREIHEPENYYQVLPYNRIFIWPQDVTEAVGKMNLVPA